MAKGSIYDKARMLGKRSGYEIEEQEGDGAARMHPAAEAARYRNKPKDSSMAPRTGGKKKHYGREFNEG